MTCGATQNRRAVSSGETVRRPERLTAQFDNAFKFAGGERQNRESALADQGDVAQRGIGFDGGERDGVGEGADGFEFDGDPAGFGGRGVGEGGLGDFGETGDGLRPNTFVEQHGIAGAHGVEVVAGLIIADAGPRGAALAHEGGPSVGFGFRFHEPVLRLLFHGGGFA